jgi:short-subunit dehydrogenase
MVIKNKSIIITGASSGTGREPATILSVKGGPVSLLSRRKEESDKYDYFNQTNKIWI